MKRSAVLAMVFLAAWCVAESARRAPGSKAPDSLTPDPDAALLGDDCLACHTGDMVRQQRLTDKQWAKTVDKMRAWGAPTEDAAAAPLVSQLAAAHGRGEGPIVPRILSAADAASLFDRQPDGALAGGDAGRGRALYADRCAACHANDGRGNGVVAALAGRRVLDRAPDLAAVVRAGRGRMPAYQDTTDAEAADLLAYLRSMPAH